MPIITPQSYSTALAPAWLLGCLIGIITLSAAARPTHAAAVPSLAFLGVQFQNDNEGLEPTTDAERARLKQTETEFVQQLAASGRYRIVPTPEGVRAKIAAGQQVGNCGGCEMISAGN